MCQPSRVYPRSERGATPRGGGMDVSGGHRASRTVWQVQGMPVAPPRERWLLSMQSPHWRLSVSLAVPKVDCGQDGISVGTHALPAITALHGCGFALGCGDRSGRF